MKTIGVIYPGKVMGVSLMDEDYNEMAGITGKASDWCKDEETGKFSVTVTNTIGAVVGVITFDKPDCASYGMPLGALDWLTFEVAK